MGKTSPTRYVIQNTGKGTAIIKTKDKDVQDRQATCEDTTALSDFGERTTVHGLRYPLQLGISSRRRWIWVMVLLACAGMLLFQIVDRIMYYYTLPVNVNVRVNYNTSLLFPAVTLCNQNAFKATLAKKLNMYRLLEKMYTASGTLTVDDLQTYGATNTTLDELFFLTAHNKEDFITKCYWRGKKCGPDDFDVIATDHGICYTFNNREVDKNISSVDNQTLFLLGSVNPRGSENGLRLTLNIEQYEYMAGPRDTVGVKMLLHAIGDVPRVHALGHAVTTGTHTFVGLKMVHIRNLPRPHGTCNDRYLQYVDHYTVAACQMDCLTRLANDTCQCRHTYMLHRNGVPSICSLHQYVTCLKPLLEGLVSLTKMCKCPVPCEFLSFYTDISYGSTSKFAMKQFVNDNDIAKLSSAMLAATEVTSRMKNATWQRTVTLGHEFIHSLADIKEVLLVSVSNRLDELTNVLNDNINNIENMYNIKTFLYNFQIYIVQKNFVGAKDDMEEQTIQAVVIGYANFIMKVEKSIRLLTDQNLTDPSVRLMIQRSTTLMLTNRIEMAHRAYANYTTLKRAYETGSPIFNYTFRNLSVEFNIPAASKYLLQHATVHNDYAKQFGYLLFFHLDNIQLVLKNIVNMTNVAHDTGFVDNDDLVRQRELFHTYMRRFVFARSVFYFETVEWPVGVLGYQLQDFNKMWYQYSQVIKNIKQRLQAMQDGLPKIKTELLHPLADIENKMKNLINFQNETQISISERLTSERIKEGIYYFKRYFQNLNANQATLIDWIKLTEKAVLELWKTVVDDKDATEYHSYMNQYQFLRNVSDIKAEISSNFTHIEHLCHFAELIANKEISFINTLTRLIDESMSYKKSVMIDSDVVRNNFLQLDVFYQQLSYKEIQQQIGYDIFALLCDIGGSMGLLLGASVLSVFEIIEFVFTQTFITIRAVF